MKRLLLLLFIAGMFFSCNISDLFNERPIQDDVEQEVPVQGIRDFAFGVVADDGSFKEWRDSVTMASINESVDVIPGDTEINWGSMVTKMYETIDCAEVFTKARIKLFPEGKTLKGLSITCADTSLIAIHAGETHFDFLLEPKGVGDTKLCVSINDGGKIISKTYSVRAMATATMNIYLDSFWKNPELNRIRYKLTGVPANVGPTVCFIQDSLAVDAECTWLDVQNAVYEEKVDVKTYTYSQQSVERAYIKDRRILLRDFSEAMAYFLTLHKYGTEFVGDSDTAIEVCYDYYPVHARLFLNVISNNPFLEFKTVLKCNEDVYAVDTYVDTGIEDEKSEELAMKHLDVFLNEYITPAEQNAIQEELNERLCSYKESEVDAWLIDVLDGMTEQEKEDFVNQLREW